jgi:RHS repeat-associated protein
MTTAAICAAREVSWRPTFYRGEQYDSDLGLYYLRARYYNPLTGRFMSRDPEEFCGCSIRNPASLHKYVYGNDDPVDLSDPLGKAANPVQLPPLGPEPVPDPEPTPGKAVGGGAAEYALIVGVISLGATAAVPAVAEEVNCILYAAADALHVTSLNLGFLQNLNVHWSTCSAMSNRMPRIPTEGEVPAPFMPLNVITEPGTKWGCDDSYENCSTRCPNGNTSYLHYDPGIKYNEGSHWDYKDCDGKTWKIWPDGTMTPA